MHKIVKIYTVFFSVFMLFLLQLTSNIVFAYPNDVIQKQNITNTNKSAGKSNGSNVTDTVKKYPPDTAFSKSLLFTPQEISAIQRALLGVDTPTKDDTPKLPRVLRLSGMMYKSPNNWVIWLNGKRVTPNRLLPEIIDISVDGSKVHLKWFDYGINDVISITLKPNQTYDLETGILLPG